MIPRIPTVTLFRFDQVPVRAFPSFWPALGLSWAALSWLAGRRRSERSWTRRGLMGAASLAVVAAADLGHTWGHTASARMAGAPMDEIQLRFDLPRTIYYDNDVSPRVHRLRSLGGPAFNAAALLFSLLWLARTKHDTIDRELAELSSAANGFLFAGSLAPVPIIDGGVILKWTLVERGQTPEQAGAFVHRLSVGLGAGGMALGGVLAALGRRWQGVGLVALGAFAALAGLRVIK